jgi:hypothetical protein
VVISVATRLNLFNLLSVLQIAMIPSFVTPVPPIKSSYKLCRNLPIEDTPLFFIIFLDKYQNTWKYAKFLCWDYIF